MAIQNDFVTDNNPAVMVHAYTHGMVPDYVKESGVITREECDSLHASAFADSVTRRLPLHTKVACWLSAMYYAGTGCQDEKVRENIEKMASVHGIEDDVKDVFAKFAEEFDKAAAAEEDGDAQYAMVLEDKDGAQTGFYPITSQSEIVLSSEKAAADFSSGLLTLPVFRKVACVIMDHAEGLNESDLDPVTVRYGVRRMPNPAGAKVMLMSRKSAGVNVAPYMELVEVCRGAIEKAASVEESMEAADRLAENIFLMDRANGITVYSDRIGDPYDCLMRGPRMSDIRKVAASSVGVYGVQVPVTDFLNLSDETIDNTFSKNVASTVKEAKAALEGELTVEKAAAAESKVATLVPDAQRVLLATLANVAW